MSEHLGVVAIATKINRARRPLTASAHIFRSMMIQRLLWLGPMTVLASIGAVLTVRLVALVLLSSAPTFGPLTLGAAIVDTAVLVTMAVVVFYRITAYGIIPGPLRILAGRRAYETDRGRLYRLIAFRVLLVSFLPDVVIALAHPENWTHATALAAMHVAAWAVCVSLLTMFGRQSAD